MKAISLWEPWASAMRTGCKTIETRSQRTKYRGPILICAAKRNVMRDVDEAITQWGYSIPGSPLACIAKYDLLFGRAACVAELVDCQRTEDLKKVITDEDLYSGDYGPGRFGWIMRNIRKIEPFPVKGQQGFFNVDIPPKALASVVEPLFLPEDNAFNERVAIKIDSYIPEPTARLQAAQGR